MPRRTMAPDEALVNRLTRGCLPTQAAKIRADLAADPTRRGHSLQQLCRVRRASLAGCLHPASDCSPPLARGLDRLLLLAWPQPPAGSKPEGRVASRSGGARDDALQSSCQSGEVSSGLTMAEHGRDSSAAANLFVHFGYFYTRSDAY